MKNIIMIHGYNGVPRIYNWLKEELEEKQYFVIVPEFPTQEGVIYDVWKDIFKKYNKYINEETIIITHSIGNEFIIKYLAENNISAKLYIGLAGFANVFETEGKEDLNRAVKDFLVTEEEIQKFIKLVDKRHCIYSDNDHIVPIEILEEYPKKIKGSSILIKGIGHMGKKSGLEKIPEVLDIIRLEEK